MPRFSIVVPVHNVQGYLRVCLESVLDQSYGDFELIVVNDCSPDGSSAIIDEFAARDERVVPVHLPVNGGIGPARNHGAKLARGEYLLFLDSDDSYTPGTLRAIAERIDATSRPDIVLFDYARTHWHGAVKRNRDAAVFEAPGPEVFTVAERPDLLDLFTVVWNKAYRLDFFREGGFTFPTGFYEDAVVVYQTLGTARTITLVDRILRVLPARRPGNTLRTPSREHSEVSRSTSGCSDSSQSRGELERWRGFLYDHIASPTYSSSSQQDRVPPSARPEFHEQAAPGPAGASSPSGHRLGADIPRVSFTLLARTPYALYGLHRVGRRAAGRAAQALPDRARAAAQGAARSAPGRARWS